MRRILYCLFLGIIVIGCQKPHFIADNYLKQAKKYLEEAKKYQEEWYKNSALTGIESDPKYIEAMVIYEKKYRETNQMAIKYYEKVIKMNPQILNGEDYLKLGNAYFESLDTSKPSIQTLTQKEKIIDKAMKSFELALKLTPKMIDAYLGLALCYEMKHQWDEAISECKKALALEPKNANIYVIMGEIYRWKGKFDLAEVNFNKAIEIDDTHINAYLNLAGVSLTTGQPEKALTRLKKVLYIKPDNLSAKVSLKIIDDSFSTIKQTKEKLRKDPKNFQLLRTIGRSYDQVGMWSEALKVYKEAYKVSPTYSIACDIAQCLISNPFRTEEDIKSAIKILEEPRVQVKGGLKDFLTLETLARAYKADNDYEKALESYKELMKLDPKNGLVYYYIGEVYEEIGNRKKAEQFFKKASKLKQSQQFH
ncbi:MAG: tetratricopeptide repeat protein [bacterium]